MDLMAVLVYSQNPKIIKHLALQVNNHSFDFKQEGML